MTDDFMRTFTSLGDMLRNAGGGKWSGKEHIGDEIERKIHERLERKREEKEEEKEDE